MRTNTVIDKKCANVFNLNKERGTKAEGGQTYHPDTQKDPKDQGGRNARKEIWRPRDGGRKNDQVPMKSG